MDKTKIIIIVFIVLIIIALGVLGFLYFRKAPTEPVTEAPVSETEPPARESISPGPETQPIAIPEMTDDEKSQEQIQNLARIFAERFGTFSNQAGFQNIDDIKSMATASMQDWLESQKAALMKKYPLNDEYYGVTSLAPIAKVESFTENSAAIMVTTQRTETRNGDVKKYNQDLKIEFVKENGKWLINAAYWQ